MIDIKKSKLRSKLLAYFFDHLGQELYLRELARIIDVDPTNLQRELKNLEKKEIFCSEKRGMQKYYFLNKKYPFFQELKKIVTATVGITNELKKIIDKFEKIEGAFIYGSYASGKDTFESDVDLLIVGKPDTKEFVCEIEKFEKKIRREINYRVYPGNEFYRAFKEGNSFILNIIDNKIIFLKGNEKSFRTIFKRKVDQKRKRN